jgi:general secretion pathway protein J
MNHHYQQALRDRGFTLLELLIAIAIFAIVAVLAMGGYNQLLMQRERASQSMQRARSIQRAVIRLTQDFQQLEPRPVRDATATVSNPALFAPTNSYTAEFTRAGWTNPAGVSRATLQRVGYRLTDGKLYRDYWTVLDRGLNAVPVQAQLIDKVKSFTLRYMDFSRQWQTSWPANSVGGLGRDRALPLAVEITLTLEDWGEIKRVIEVPSS